MLRVAAVLAVAIAVSVVAVSLGRWQYHRHEARSAELHAFEAGQASALSPLAEVMPPGTLSLPAVARWREVTVSGHFDVATQTWLRNRPVGGIPAVHALAWFVTDTGEALLVDAGWVDARTPARPSLPSVEQSLTLTLREGEADDGRRDAGATRITEAQMPAAPAPELPGYGVVSEACGEPCGAIPGLAVTPLPTLGLGPHLSYAWQWWLLAAAAPFIGISVARREARELGDADGQERRSNTISGRRSAPGLATRVGQRLREAQGPSDEDIEDAL